MPFNGYFTCYIIMQVEKGKNSQKEREKEGERDRDRQRQIKRERMCHTMFDALK